MVNIWPKTTTENKKKIEFHRNCVQFEMKCSRNPVVTRYSAGNTLYLLRKVTKQSHRSRATLPRRSLSTNAHYFKLEIEILITFWIVITITIWYCGCQQCLDTAKIHGIENQNDCCVLCIAFALAHWMHYVNLVSCKSDSRFSFFSVV